MNSSKAPLPSVPVADNDADLPVPASAPFMGQPQLQQPGQPQMQQPVMGQPQPMMPMTGQLQMQVKNILWV